MVALPATGLEWAETYGFNPLGIRKGVITNVLIRDYRGSLTSLADPLVGLNADGIFTPYTQDGKYRSDLLLPSFPGGQFYDPGSLKDDGTKITDDTTVEGTAIAQSRRDQRYDLTGENDEIMFTTREDNPIVDALRMGRYLANLPDLGGVGYAVTKPAEGDLIERQVIALAEDGGHRWAYIFPRLSKKKGGDTQLNRKLPHELPLTLGALLCPYAKYPVAIAREGAGWRALGGAPLFSGSPTATAVAGGQATVAFLQPVGVGDPWTYALRKIIGGVETAQPISNASVVGSNVTLTTTGLASGANVRFKVVATGTNAASATSAESNQITALA